MSETSRAPQGKLTTHVLDTAHGRPAHNLRIELFRLAGDRREPLADVRTNSDGRCDGPLLAGNILLAGEYELLFHVGDYFTALGINSPTPAFLGTVPVRFGIADPGQHYHVPLLVSPFGYSTYRGS